MRARVLRPAREEAGESGRGRASPRRCRGPPVPQGFVPLFWARPAEGPGRLATGVCGRRPRRQEVAEPVEGAWPGCGSEPGVHVLFLGSHPALPAPGQHLPAAPCGSEVRLSECVSCPVGQARRASGYPGSGARHPGPRLKLPGYPRVQVLTEHVELRRWQVMGTARAGQAGGGWTESWEEKVM